MVEKGGKRLESLLSRPNPTASDHCVRKDHPNVKKKCVGCNQNEGIRNCQKSNALCKYECKNEGCDSVYIGETSRNIFSRSLEHQSKYASNDSGSFIKKHQTTFHNGEPANMKLSNVKTFKDCLSRQVSESAHIFKTQEERKLTLMNSKSEWRQPSMIAVRSEVVRREVGN